MGECMVELSPHHPHLLRPDFAGDTYNTAVYLKRCLPACDVSYMTAIGTDAISDDMLARFAEEGLNTRWVHRRSDKTVGLYMVHVDKQGERSFSYWRSDSAARQMMRAPLPVAVPDIVYVSGITLAILDPASRELLISALVSWRERGARVAFDPNYRARLWDSAAQAREWIGQVYHICDIAFPGMDDHRTLFNHTSAQAIADYLADTPITEMVIKDGAEDMTVVAQGQLSCVAVTPAQRVVDTTSAGDAFVAGYLAARISGASATDAATQAASLSSMVIGFKGAIVPRPDFNDWQRQHAFWSELKR